MSNQPVLPSAPPSHKRQVLIRRGLTWAIAALSGATLLGLLGDAFFLFELLSHFAVQYVAAGVVLGLISLAFYKTHKSLVLPATAFIVALLNFSRVVSWLSNEKASLVPTTTRDVRVFHANVLYTEPEMQRTMKLIHQHDPDLFVLQEMTPASIRALAPLRKSYPYQFETWSKGPCHILVGSRTPFTVDRGAAKTQHVIHLRTNVRGKEMSLVTVHTRTPVIPSWFKERNDQLAYVAQKTRQEAVPTVLLGDFNVSVFSPVYHRIFESAFSTNNGNAPVLTACRKGFGLQPTWPRFFLPAMIPIDHAFVNNGFQPVNFQTIEQPGSDHKAVVVDLKRVN